MNQLPSFHGKLPSPLVRSARLTGHEHCCPPVSPTNFLPEPDRQRTKLWDLHETLHCSIIGTCLTCAELRKIIVKIQGPAAAKFSDHVIHREGVILANQAGGPGKLLNKALDTQHGDWIKKFSGAQSATDVATLWREALAQGAIPGSYWALLTNPATDAALIRKAFGDVHMLSHLVGAANRADIRRLTELKDQIDVLTAKVERQEARLRDLSLERDEKNTALQSLLSERVSTVSAPLGAAEEAATIRALQDLIQRMHGKLDRETSRRKNLEQLQRNWREEKLALLAERDQLSEAHQRALEELTAVETLLVAPDAGDDQADAMPTIAGLTILFVGGRTHAIPSLRSLIEGYGAYFLHHDGGQAENLNLLPGLIGRADLVLFPIDCISHNAALMLKRLCGQGGKTFLPMPRSGVGSVLRSLISWTAMDADVQGHVSAAN